MSSIPTILFCLFLLGILGIILNRHHLLSLLLCLELLLISLFLNLSLFANSLYILSTLNLTIIILTFSACEASAGLALMVSISRSHNTDLLTNINLLKN
uniref:NADH-ubiquinone oxidoreductase chain 4L n=1 Tax=Ocnus glacialis TaxID=3074281 RepID=A0AA51YIF5_9ECHN|nr:NADH dehydrogenase subunit 4L [Ocnus glacialis]WMW14036.1 NADH dehydrogenase subunit 4L [Ocnus glacialis]